MTSWYYILYDQKVTFRRVDVDLHGCSKIKGWKSSLSVSFVAKKRIKVNKKKKF